MEKSTDTPLDQVILLLRYAFAKARQSGDTQLFGLDLEQRVHTMGQLPRRLLQARIYRPGGLVVELTSVPESAVFPVAQQLIYELQWLRREALLLEGANEIESQEPEAAAKLRKAVEHLRASRTDRAGKAAA